MKKISILILLFLILIFLILILNKNQSFSNNNLLSGDIESINAILKGELSENEQQIKENSQVIGSNYVKGNPYYSQKYVGSIFPIFEKGIMRLYNLLKFYIN